MNQDKKQPNGLSFFSRIMILVFVSVFFYALMIYEAPRWYGAPVAAILGSGVICLIALALLRQNHKDHERRY